MHVFTQQSVLSVKYQHNVRITWSVERGGGGGGGGESKRKHLRHMKKSHSGVTLKPSSYL